MRRPTTSLLVTMALAVTAVVFVAGSAAAAPPKKTTTTKAKTTKTTTTKSKTSPTSTTSASSLDPNAQANANGPGSHYSVINGTANAASDHVIAGSSAFPNYATGAVDNYYSMAHAHVDNSPFAEGTASPLDTGPVGQTAAAGNFQQPQYADARWPGDEKSGKASYGTQGQPYAVAGASEYNATAEASLAKNGLSGPSAPGGSNAPIVLPKGFDGKLRAALAGWKAKWQSHGVIPKPTLPVPVPIPAPTGKITTPTVPAAPAPTPIPGVTTPTTPLGGLSTPPPVTTVSLPPVPRTASRDTTTTQSRSMQSASSSSSSSAPAPADGESLLESTTSSGLDPKTDALVTTGESRLGRVSLGGGQIVIEGIHVSATITNDGKGTPSYKVGVTVASATIGGVPVTIDQDGVHLATQSQALPYKQASDGLNAALKQAGIQLFLVGPEITTNSCNGASGGGGTSSTTTTTTSSNDATTASSNSCAPDSGMSSPAGSSSCDQTGTGSSTTTTTSSTPSVTTPTPGPGTTTSKTTTTTGSQTSTTSTTSSCGQTGFTGSSSCTKGTTPTKTSSYNQTGTTSTSTTPTTSTTSTTTAYPAPPMPGSSSGSGSGDQTSPSAGGTNAGEMTLIATGLHVVFVQPAGAPSGVPAQNTEHILGEVYLDSLAVPGVPFTAGAGNFNLFGSSPSSTSSGSSSSSTSSSSCLGGVAGGSKSSGGVAGGLSAGGSNAAGSLGSSGSGSGYGSSSQPGTGSSAGPLGTSLAHLASWARHKPKWLLLSYLVWQALAIAAAASLWKWQGEGAS